MSTIGLDSLYYAKITEGTDGAETYATPRILAKAIKADLSVELAEAILYADDAAAEVVKAFKSGKLSLGVDDIGTAAAAGYVGGGRHGDEAALFVNGAGVAYTVPQKLHKDTKAEKIDLFFRVNKVFGKSKIVVSSDDGEIISFKRTFMAPGEMQHAVLPVEQLAGFDQITVSAEEGEKK